MADQSVALDVKTLPLQGPISPLAPLAQAQAYQTGQTQQQTAQTQLQMLNRQNAGQDISFRNQLIANAAAHGLDSDLWDAEFQKAADAGAPEAVQFIGRYSPLLQQRLESAYGAAPSGPAGTAGAPGAAQGGSQTSDDVMARSYAKYTPQQLTASLQKTQAFMQAVQSVRDQPSLDRAVAYLTSLGLPGAAASLGRQWSPLQTPQQLYGLLTQAQQRAGWLQNRVASASTGAPAPLIKNEVQNIGNVGYSVDLYAAPGSPAAATALTPTEPKKIGMDQFGKDVYGVPDPSSPGGYRRVDVDTLPTTQQGPQGGGVSIADAAGRIQGRVENTGGNPAARNPMPGQTAMGNGQFIDRTWLDTFKQTQPDLARTLSDKQILALRAIPGISDTMTQAYAQQNAQVLTKAGLPVTTATLALAHHFGASGATKIMNAPPDTPLSSLLPASVMAVNPDLKGQTAGSYAQRIAAQVGNDPVNVGGAPGTPSPATSASMDTHGDDYLKTLPPDKANVVKMIAEGRAPFPSGFIMKTPYGQWLTQAVGQYEPGFTAQTYQQRQKAYNDWYGGGKSQQTVKALDQALSHTLGLADNVAKLGNYGLGAVVNKPINEAESAVGLETGYVPLRTNAHAVADELGKVWKGAGLSDTEIRNWVEGFRLNGSVPQQKADVNELMKLVNGGIDALEDQRETSFGPLAKTLPPVISPAIRAKLDAIQTWAGGKPPVPPAASSVAAATPPVPGAKLYEGTWYVRGPDGKTAVPVPAAR